MRLLGIGVGKVAPIHSPVIQVCHRVPSCPVAPLTSGPDEAGDGVLRVLGGPRVLGAPWTTRRTDALERVAVATSLEWSAAGACVWDTPSLPPLTAAVDTRTSVVTTPLIPALPPVLPFPEPALPPASAQWMASLVGERSQWWRDTDGGRSTVVFDTVDTQPVPAPPACTLSTLLAAAAAAAAAATTTTVHHVMPALPVPASSSTQHADDPFPVPPRHTTWPSTATTSMLHLLATDSVPGMDVVPGMDSSSANGLLVPLPLPPPHVPIPVLLGGGRAGPLPDTPVPPIRTMGTLTAFLSSATRDEQGVFPHPHPTLSTWTLPPCATPVDRLLRLSPQVPASLRRLANPFINPMSVVVCGPKADCAPPPPPPLLQGSQTTVSELLSLQSLPQHHGQGQVPMWNLSTACRLLDVAKPATATMVWGLDSDHTTAWLDSLQRRCSEDSVVGDATIGLSVADEPGVDATTTAPVESTAPPVIINQAARAAAQPRQAVSQAPRARPGGPGPRPPPPSRRRPPPPSAAPPSQALAPTPSSPPTTHHMPARSVVVLGTPGAAGEQAACATPVAGSPPSLPARGPLVDELPLLLDAHVGQAATALTTAGAPVVTAATSSQLVDRIQQHDPSNPFLGTALFLHCLLQVRDLVAAAEYGRAYNFLAAVTNDSGHVSVMTEDQVSVLTEVEAITHRSATDSAAKPSAAPVPTTATHNTNTTATRDPAAGGAGVGPVPVIVAEAMLEHTVLLRAVASGSPALTLIERSAQAVGGLAHFVTGVQSCVSYFKARELFATEDAVAAAVMGLLCEAGRFPNITVVLEFRGDRDATPASLATYNKFIVGLANCPADVHVRHTASVAESAVAVTAAVMAVVSTGLPTDMDSGRAWVLEQATNHEGFLTAFPSLNPLVAQLILTDMPLRTALHMDADSLISRFPDVCPDTLQRFHDLAQATYSWGRP